jgi:hypothetical protein
MSYFLLQWRRFRLFLMLRGMPLEQQRKIINQARLEAALEKYSRALRRIR